LSNPRNYLNKGGVATMRPKEDSTTSDAFQRRT